jgi:hypothetical protein
MSRPYIYGETFSPEEPKPKTIVFDIISEHLKSEERSPENHDALNDVYKALAGNEIATANALEDFEHKGLISRDDSLILTVLLASSRTLGPDLDFLRNAIINRNFDQQQVDPIIEQLPLDEAIVGYLKNVASRLRKT